MVNVGTGNLIVQSDDMNVPHKGIALAFRRTYNSQSGHDVYGSDGSQPGLYGNGWTNTFDAHIVASNGNIRSVYDIDGARYDYMLPANWTYTAGRQATSITPGQHATLTYDGGCGWQWTKKTGTIYYFYITNPNNACPSIGTVGAYAGRLHQIIGRNQNTWITLSYSWDNGNAGIGGKISQIVATTESGLSATLNFADFNGYRLLMSLIRPDGVQITYGYGGYLNMRTVTLPPNNAAGTPVVKFYGYGSWPGGNPAGVMNYISSPRWNNSNGSDGERLQIGSTFTGSDNAHSSLSEIDHTGFMDPTPADGTNTPIQPAPPDGAGSAANPYLAEYFALGAAGAAATPTFRDSDGHYTNWITNAAGSPTQTQECTATKNQQCTGTLLITGQQWDADNNLISAIDARGFETDYKYDANANTIAIGEPSTTTAAGTFRPTKLFDYDQYNNVIGYCDEVATHAANQDFPLPATTSDSLCASHAAGIPHTTTTYQTSAEDVFGEISTITSPLGYKRSFTYPQTGSLDFGLPTDITGDVISQADGSSRQEHLTFRYDAHGNIISHGTGTGTWSLTYDTENQLISVTDPDNVTSYTCYYPSGDIRAQQTALQYKMDGTVCGANSVLRDYDVDGNQKLETHHFGNVIGTVQKWYDGAGRLVEVAQPQEPSSLAATAADYARPRPDNWTFPWLTRYVYDLGGTSNPSTGTGIYGGLAVRQEYTYSYQASPQPPGWQSLYVDRYDGLDRLTTEVESGTNFSGHGLASSLWNVYDENGQAGFKTTEYIAATNERKHLSYDERGKLTREAYADDSGVQYTPSKSYTYDPVGRISSASSTGPGSSFGSMSYAYDVDGNMLSRNEAGAGYDDAPSTIGYSFYPDGRRRGLNVTAQSNGGFTQSDLFTYSYRADGLLQTKQVNLPVKLAVLSGNGRFTWTYSPAGRLTEKDDPFTGASIPGVYGQARVRSVSSTRLARAALSHSALDTLVESLKKPLSDPLAAPYSAHANGQQPQPKITARRSSTSGLESSAVPCPLSGVNIVAPIRPSIVPCCSGDCPSPAPTGPPTATPTPVPARPFSGLKIAHDQYGEISSYQLPGGGTYNQFSFDAEGSATDYYGFGGVPGDSAHPAKHINNEFNVRGELTGQHFFDGAATSSYSADWPSFAAFPANGTMAPYRDQNVDPAWQSLNGIIDNWNTTNGKWTQQTQNISYNTAAGACKRIGSQLTWTQDASGRDVGIHAAQIQSFPPDCSSPAYMGGDVTRTYDFDGRLMQWRFADGNFWPGATEGLQCAPPMNNGLPSLTAGYMGARNYGWGPEGKLIETSDGGGIHALHWDGDELLFVTDGQGGINDLKISSDASVENGKFVVIDRDWTGVAVQDHDASGYSAWLPLSPFQQACLPNSPSPASPGFDNPAGIVFVRRSLDGYYDGLNVFQGVRTYDPQTTQWTTPDDHAGSMDDPMTQKPYMWNRNNPYKYQDPTGYDWQEVANNRSDLAKLTRVNPFLGFLTTLLIATSQPAGADAREGPKSPKRLNDDYLKRVLRIDGHALKYEVLGNRAPIAQYDVYQDTSDKSMWFVHKQSGIFIRIDYSVGDMQTMFPAILKM